MNLTKRVNCVMFNLVMTILLIISTSVVIPLMYPNIGFESQLVYWIFIGLFALKHLGRATNIYVNIDKVKERHIGVRSCMFAIEFFIKNAQATSIIFTAIGLISLTIGKLIHG